jgi:hypothetical protein
MAGTFDNLEPKRGITDPEGQGVERRLFPAHLFRFVAPDDPANLDEGTLVVAWTGTSGARRKQTPVHNEMIEVANEKELAEALEDGWAEKPQLEAAKPRSNGKANGKGATAAS